jgi:hypothetical protein
MSEPAVRLIPPTAASQADPIEVLGDSRAVAARSSQSTAAPSSLLIPLTDVPSALAISRAHLARLRAAGRFGPAVLRLGRRLLVRRDELAAWVADGMPDSRTWAAMQAAASRRTARVI